jgi:hypothetical protein
MQIYLKLPKYLLEWCLFEYGDANGVVSFPRGGAENDVLEMMLDRLPDGMEMPERQPDELPIEIPAFKSKPEKEGFCYMTEPGKKVLRHVIMVRLRVRLWHDLYRIEKLQLPITDTIYDWMERNGIEDDARSWEALRQMFMRQRNSYRQGKPSEKKRI